MTVQVVGERLDEKCGGKVLSKQGDLDRLLSETGGVRRKSISGRGNGRKGECLVLS